MVDVVDPFPWPVDQLPFFAEHKTWEEGPRIDIADFTPPAGNSIRRRRSYIPGASVSFSCTVSNAELSAFLDFFYDTLKDGIYNFTAVDPRTEELTEYQFAALPTWRDITTNGDGTYWRLQLSLHKVNLPPAVA